MKLNPNKLISNPDRPSNRPRPKLPKSNVGKVMIRHEDIPDSWLDRCSGDGWETKFDKEGNRYYEYNVRKSDGVRPCKKM